MKGIILFATSSIALTSMVNIGDILPSGGQQSQQDLFPYNSYDVAMYSDSITLPFTEGRMSSSGTIYFDYPKEPSCLAHYFYIGLTNKTRNTEELLLDKYFELVKGGNEIEYSFDLTNLISIGESGSIVFYIVSSCGDILAEATYPITISNLQYNIAESVESPLVVTNLGYKIGFDQTLKEEYRFSNFTPYFTNDRYYRLSLDEYTFEYISKYAFTCEDISLTFLDKNKLFPYLPVNEEGLSYIPLSYKQENKAIRLEFPTQMYVDPITLEMSLIERINTQKASFFYLPRGKQESFNGYEFTLVFKSMGQNKINARYNMTFDVGYNLIGDCISSDYCVRGGIRD